MIGLIGLSPEVALPWVDVLRALPEPPAWRHSGFLIALSSQPSVDLVIEWCRRIRSARPHLPIGAVVQAADPRLVLAMRTGVRLRPVLEEREVRCDAVPRAVLEEVRDATVEGRILERWTDQGLLDVPEARQLVAAAAAVGVTGAGVPVLCGRLGCSRATLYRRFDSAGLPTPKVMLSNARLESVKVRLGLGMEPHEARRAAGWFSVEAYQKVRSRAGHRETNRGVG
ncbi:MAG TPA: hypothetical protein VGC81_09465 [Candidatus Methylomirabilis sp.]|jgi:hypothetical protein